MKAVKLPHPTANHRLNELIGLLVLVVASLLFLSLLSYHPADASWNTLSTAAPANWIGPAGALVADLLFQAFGIGAFLLAVGVAAYGWKWFHMPPRAGAPLTRTAGVLLSALALGAALAQWPHAMLWRGRVPLSGAMGAWLAEILVAGFSRTGAWILTLATGVCGVFLATTFSIRTSRIWLAAHLPSWSRPFFAGLARFSQAWQARRARRRERRVAYQAERAAALEAARKTPSIPASFTPARSPVVHFEDASTRARRELLAGAAKQQPQPAAKVDRMTASTRRSEASDDVSEAEPTVMPLLERDRIMPAPTRLRPDGYKMPASALLHEPNAAGKVDEEELRRLALVLKAKMEEFDVRGQVTQINPGPVVTTYEFKPEAGIKYNRIPALGEDLCQALEAESVYIERIPGKSTVGIEVPNRQRETIVLREVVESREFHDSGSHLTVALGKDINGRIVVTDLTAMPHLLIAGSTGSGKSVALNCILTSLLYKSTPDEVRFILVDPKRLELGLYDGIPHLYTPIITEAKLAANVLRNATREMERRLKLLASRGVRGIAQYNKLFDKPAPGLFDQLEAGADNRPLPYIVIIIDELADLMIVDAKNVEESITRLAQMARAVGIHLILATQRPSVDVITGLIKANFPARVSFRVATKIDSRTILDAQGAEALLGKGDMLFLPPGSSRLQRVHGAFVSEKEIAAVVEFWAKQGEPQMDESFLKPPAEENEAGEFSAAGDGEAGESGGNDPMYEDAVRVVLEYGKASTSLLQRRLRIGYGRAAHLIDLMYNDGLVGPADGPKPREVLKRPDWLREVDEALR